MAAANSTTLDLINELQDNVLELHAIFHAVERETDSEANYLARIGVEKAQALVQKLADLPVDE